MKKLSKGDQAEQEKLASEMDKAQAELEAAVNDYNQKADEAWGKVAIKPQNLDKLIRDTIQGFITDHDAWRAVERQETEDRDNLKKLGQKWPEVEKFLRTL